MIWNMFFQNMKEKQFLSKMKEKKAIKVRNGKSKGSLYALLLVLCMIIGGCVRPKNAGSEKNSVSTTEDSETLRIVTTIFPQYDFVRQIAGENVRVTSLARGLGFGDDLEYADELTLGRALTGRQIFNP